MRKNFQKVLVFLLSAGMVCGLGGISALASEADSVACDNNAAATEMCDSCTGEDGCGCCCCADTCEETDAGNPDSQILALTPEDTNKPYHGHSFGSLNISGANEEVSLDIGESISLTVKPYAHVQYVGCAKGDGCGPGLCNGGDESVYHCWEENKGCVCDFKYDTLRLATVTVEADPEGILSYEGICDYSSLETAGDMTDGTVVLTAQAAGLTTVTVKAALYDWEDAEVTFQVTVNGGEEPDKEEPGDEDPGIVEPGPVDPGDEEPDGGPVDKNDLENEINEAEGLSEDDYTADSWEALQTALVNAQAVLADENATEEEIEAAARELKTAMDNLQSVEENPEPEPEPEPDPEPDPEPTSGDDYTGFVKGAGEHAYYMENGKITGKKQGILKDTDNALGDAGAWYYVIDSEVQYGFTGLGNFKNENGWWYIKKGKVDFSHNGVDKNKNGWYYVTGGKVQFGFTGLANYKNENGWWYIAGGKVDFTHNGVDKNKNGWYYVTGGKVRFDFTGLANYKNANGWWYIAGGKVDFTHNGVDKNKNGWWYIKAGKVDFTFKGIASNQNGTWYLSGGKVQFGFTGRVTYDGKSYTVTAGKAN